MNLRVEAGDKAWLRCQVLADCSNLNLSVMEVTEEKVLQAMKKAAEGHSNQKEVERMMANPKTYSQMVITSIKTGEYINHLEYRPLEKTNNGKIRKIDSPFLFTFVLQHLFLVLARPLYQRHDNYNCLHCKPECGITAKDPTKSVIHKMKHTIYDKLHLHYGVIIDERQCYQHHRPKVFRREMRRITSDRELIEFGINVCFYKNRLPIGTPTSSFVHDVIMLDFDHWMKQATRFSIRVADDNFGAVFDKEEASQLKWRIQNFWWYRYQIRAKVATIRIINLDEEFVSFSGYVIKRNGRGIAEHDKGYTRIRDNIRSAASRCKKDESWSAYYGILSKGDCYALMQKIEQKMKLRQLTEKIRINRSLDAPNINPRDLAGKQFTIYDYDIKCDSKGTPNWIKCLIGVPEVGEDENPTGRMKAFEFHGSYMYIVEFMTMAERTFGKKNMLPLEEMEIENQCGYIFKGSTNQMEYIDDGGGQTSLFTNS